MVLFRPGNRKKSTHRTVLIRRLQVPNQVSTVDWKGLKIKKSVGNRKIIMSDEVRHRIGKG
jgi:hypothetical protein